MRERNVELVTDGGYLCGEAPLWDFREQCLYWVDQDNPGLFRYRPAADRVETLTGRVQMSGIALNRAGGLVAGGRTGLFLWNDGEVRELCSVHENRPLMFNDIVAGPGGRTYGGTLYWDGSGMQQEGCLCRFDPSGDVTIEDEGIVLSNGLAFSPDNQTLYFTDTGRRSIFSYSVDTITGSLSKKRRFALFQAEDGVPDGITIDSEGFLWVALWYGGSVVRIDPDGKEADRIAIPAKQVSSVMFGGAELNDLYVTTAGEYWPSFLEPKHFDRTAPMGGALYRVRLETEGRLEHLADF